MTIEDKLKDLIISRYGNLSNFSKEINMANSTLATIMKNGIHKANVTNIIKICKKLGISTDELAKNRIVPVTVDLKNEYKMRELRDILQYYKLNLKSYDGCSIDGYPIDKYDAEMILDAIELVMDFIKKKKKRETK